MSTDQDGDNSAYAFFYSTPLGEGTTHLDDSQLIPSEEPWKLLVVDDDAEVHSITSIVLSDLKFDNRPLQLLHAYSGKEAIRLFEENPDIAVALVDVVMETDDAGLWLVQKVRNDISNSFVRLILRTGQPGSAPEREIVLQYDINDYKEKTELSAKKLFTAIISALRSYRDIVELDKARRAMERMVSASEALFGTRSVFRFTEILLPTALNVMGTTDGAGILLCMGSSFHAPGTICATYGLDDHNEGENTVSSTISESITEAADISFSHRSAVIVLRSSYGDDYRLWIRFTQTLTALDRSLLELFRLKGMSALDRLILSEKTRESQQQAICALAKVRENNSSQREEKTLNVSVFPATSTNLITLPSSTSSRETSSAFDFLSQLAIQAEVAAWGDQERAAAHILRLSRYSYLLAKLCGHDEPYCLALSNAARFHDIGNLFVKQYRYCSWSESDADRKSLALPHTTTGYEYIRDNTNSTELTAQLSTEVTRYHHEAWDGRGYPDGASRTGIPPSARIVAILDFFDITTNACPECERPANGDREAFEMISLASGYLFDPSAVKHFINNKDLFISIRADVDLFCRHEALKKKNALDTSATQRTNLAPWMY